MYPFRPGVPYLGGSHDTMKLNTYLITAATANGGEVFMPMQEAFFASRFAMLHDRRQQNA